MTVADPLPVNVIDRLELDRAAHLVREAALAQHPRERSEWLTALDAGAPIHGASDLRVGWECDCLGWWVAVLCLLSRPVVGSDGGDKGRTCRVRPGCHPRGGVMLCVTVRVRSVVWFVTGAVGTAWGAVSWQGEAFVPSGESGGPGYPLCVRR